jgi:hypothetical protein
MHLSGEVQATGIDDSAGRAKQNMRSPMAGRSAGNPFAIGGGNGGRQ